MLMASESQFHGSIGSAKLLSILSNFVYPLSMIIIIFWFILFFVYQIFWVTYIFYLFIILFTSNVLLFLINTLFFDTFYDFTISYHQASLIVFYRKRSIQTFYRCVICFRVLFFIYFWHVHILYVILCLGFKIYLLYPNFWVQ